MSSSRLREALDGVGARSLRAGGVDLDGLWRAKQLNVAHLDGADHLSQCNFVFGIDIQDQLYDPVSQYTGWAAGWPDVKMWIDPDTVRAVPWHDGTATAICDYVTWDGEPLHLCPRGLLKRATGAVREAGYEPVVAVELEFFVFRGRPAPGQDGHVPTLQELQSGNHGYHAFRGMDLIERWSHELEAYGVPVEGTLTEWGASQFEINIRYGSPVEVADNVLITKHALKALAAREDLTVSFMARPTAVGPGSSGHLHVSLKENGRNAFYDADAEHRTSATMQRFVAGVVRDLPDTALLALPFVNSYKRVGEYLSSPTVANVGIENRTTGIRLINHEESGARMELRVPGADANPYLTLAATLLSGLSGIEEDLAPVPVFLGDGYTDTDSAQLPRSLEQGIDRFEASKRPVQLFGQDFVDHYLHSRRWELAQWRQAVTDWETDRYLEMV